MNDGNVSPLKAFLRQKWVRIVLIIDVIAVLIIVVFLIWQSTKVSTINLDIAPVNATISINGDTKYTNGQYAMAPGTYEVKISHEGLEEKAFTIELAPRHVVSLTTFLSDADHNFEFYKLKENYLSYTKLASIASAENNLTYDSDASAEVFIAKTQKYLDLYQSALPIHEVKYELIDNKDTMVYDITLRRGNTCEKYLCIEAFMILTDNTDKVKSMLKEKGFDLEGYEVQYKIY